MFGEEDFDARASRLRRLDEDEFVLVGQDHGLGHGLHPESFQGCFRQLAQNRRLGKLWSWASSALRRLARSIDAR